VERCRVVEKELETRGKIANLVVMSLANLIGRIPAENMP
jgi:hypothetical protein